MTGALEDCDHDWHDQGPAEEGVSTCPQCGMTEHYYGGRAAYSSGKPFVIVERPRGAQ